ncbi:MAG: hypothetical protein ABSG84_16105 [Acidobacteriaceae bacterium]|jgi:hypothetical protein
MYISRRAVTCLLFLAAICLVVLPVARAQQSLDNDAVLKLVKSGLGEDLIAQTIAASPGHYDTGVNAIIALKQAGVTDKEISAMIAKNAGPSVVPPVAAVGPALPPGVDEIGVYYKGPAGNWVEFKPEIVNYKSGGFLKSLASDGIVKPDMNGHIPGKESKLALNRPVQVLIYAPDGTSPEEYLLLKMRVNSNNREFRSMTGGVIHSSTGAQRDDVTFKADKVGLRLYQFTLGPDSAPGEYGVLPPGSVSTINAASAGKIFTFHIVE